MKHKTKLQCWIPSTLTALALAGSASLGLAANFSYTFDSDLQGFGPGNGNTTVAWTDAQNRGSSGGSLQCTLDYTAGSTLNLAIDPVGGFDTTAYFDVEFDMMIDPASGTDGSGGYGNMQIGDFDAGYDWHGEWYGGVSSTAGTWKHYKVPFSAAYGPRAHLQIMVQAASGSYSSDLIVYIDNVVIQDGTPPNKVVLYDFAWPEECVADSIGGSVGSANVTFSQDTTLHTDGSLKMVVDYGSGNTGWQDGDGEFHDFPANVDPSKFTYVDFDLYLDAPTGLPSYGQFQMHYWWSWTGIGTAALSAANIGTWTHYSFALPSGSPQGFVFHPGGNNMSGVFTYYIDNVTMWKPATPPTITAMRREASPTSQGAEITMNAINNQYQRDAICVPATTPDYSWVGRTPIDYAFTLANFPDAVVHSGFEAHLFIVNESTIPAAGAWNETYGAPDWNASDLLKFTVENNPAGGVIVRLNWKTGLPGANPPDANQVVNADGTTANGTWTLHFDTDTTGTISGPGSFTASFTLPPTLATQFDPNGAAELSFIQFGMGQNDNAANNHNYNASGVFTEISMDGGLYQFDETFPGPTLTSSGTAWRTTGDAVQWVPANTALWLTWTTPADGFSMKVSGTVAPMSAYTDAGVTGIYADGAVKVGAVPAASLPAGNAAFFRLSNP